MRYIFIILIMLVVPAICLSEQIEIGIDRLVAVTPAPESLQVQNSLAAVHFTLPALLDSAKIIYAELVIPFDFSAVKIKGDSVLEFRVNPIIHDWSPQNVWNNPWSSPARDLDTLASFSFTILMSDPKRSCVYMDITAFIKEIVDGYRANFGLMISPTTFEDRAYQMTEGIIRQIGNSALIRITYR